jgi:hypothetical protein
VPQPRRAQRSSTLKRKIHFYRAVVVSPRKPGVVTKFDTGAPRTRIAGLPFNDAGRYFQDGERILCAWIDRATARGQLRFAVIRRDGLPYAEQRGAQTALRLAATAGLVEQSHVVCFPNNIVGCEFNFYGPRLPALARYLTGRGGPKAQQVRFEPLTQ